MAQEVLGERRRAALAGRRVADHVADARQAPGAAPVAVTTAVAAAVGLSPEPADVVAQRPPQVVPEEQALVLGRGGKRRGERGRLLRCVHVHV